MSDVFSVREGLKQGDALFCLLFNQALEIAGIQTNKTLAYEAVQVLGFATAAEDTFTNLRIQEERIGLMINVSEAKCMKSEQNQVAHQPVHLARRDPSMLFRKAPKGRRGLENAMNRWQRIRSLCAVNVETVKCSEWQLRWNQIRDQAKVH